MGGNSLVWQHFPPWITLMVHCHKVPTRRLLCMSGLTFNFGEGIVFLGSTLDSLSAQMTVQEVQEVQGVNEVSVNVLSHRLI